MTANAAEGRDRGQGPRTVPFTDVEEAVYDLEDAYTPWNVHIELETATTVDVARLEAAIETACEAHPLARARKQPHDVWDRGYRWEIPESVEAVPLEVTAVDGADGVASARSAFYEDPVSLRSPPPFRVRVLRPTDGWRADGAVDREADAAASAGDRILVNANHVAADGVGALRLLRSICRAYRGDPPVTDPVSFEDARRFLADHEPESIDARLDRLGSAAGHLLDATTPPARIATDSDSDASGWGFVHRRVDPSTAAALVGTRPEGVSVNDVLLAALHRAIGAWNRDHGERAGKISLMMPVNLRPRDRFYDGVGMYALFERVTTRPSDRRTTDATVAAVAEQTSDRDPRERAASLNDALDLIPPGTPVGLKRHLPAALRGPGERLLDTAMLSNLGRVPDPGPTLGDGDERLWFSPPAWAPTPLGVGVVTHADTVTLVFRHLRAHLDRPAGDAFADRYLETLESVVPA